MDYFYFIFEIVKWFKKSEDQQERDNAIQERDNAIQERDNAIKLIKTQHFHFLLSNIFWLVLVIIGLIALRF